MRITLIRSGGFAGLRRPPVVVDTTELTSDDVRQLEACFAAASFYKLKPVSGSSAQPDRFHYSISVDDHASARHSVDFSEADAPPALLDLVKLIARIHKHSGMH
jgi:hypothetical protein